MSACLAFALHVQRAVPLLVLDQKRVSIPRSIEQRKRRANVEGEGRQLGLRVIWETVGFKGTFGKAEIGRDVEETVIQVNIEMLKKIKIIFMPK